jgi:hypothetical protein
VFEGYSENHN